MPLSVLAELGGVASTRRLAEHGVTEQQVRAAVRRGELLRLRRGRVALPTADAAVVAAVRVGGALTCTSVLRRHGIWTAHDHHLHVRVPPHSGHVGQPTADGRPMEAVRMHRTALLGPPGDACDPVPTALAVAAMCQSRLDAVVSLDSALNQGFVSLATLHAEFSSLSAGHRRYLDLVDPTSGSGLETKARLRLRSHRVGLRTQVRIEGVGLVDLLIGDRLVLEVDGYRWHSSRQSFNEDRRRDLELAHRGYRVVRLSYEQVTFDWAACERVLLDLVRRDVHRWPVRSGGESRR